MVNIEKVNRVYKKSLSKSFLLVMTILLMIGCAILIRYRDNIQGALKEEAKLILENASAQNITNISFEISDRHKKLYLVAEKIQIEKELDLERALAIVHEYNSRTKFENMGVIDKNGTAHMLQGELLDVSQYKGFVEGMKGEGNLSTECLSGYENEKSIMSIIPIFNQEEVEMLLIGIYGASSLMQWMNLPSFEGQGKAIIMNTQGEMIVHGSDGEGINLEFLHEHVKKHHFVVKGYKESIPCNESYLEYDINGTTYLAYHEEFGMYDWTLVSCVPKVVVYKNLNVINRMMYNMMLFMSMAVFVLVLVFLKEYLCYQKDILDSICIDELTGLHNYEYLKKYFKMLKVKERENKFLVVMDIDKFKSINIMYKTYVGDELLKYIATIYQKLLPNEKLFRCESDIFASILEGKSKQDVIKKN